jgi:hypothetical protein
MAYFRIESLYRSILLTGWLALGGHFLFAQNTASVYTSGAIREIESFLEKSKQDMVTLRQTRRLLSLQYDSMVVDILNLKEKKEIGFFDRMQLKGLLKDCEDFSKQFVKIDKLLAAHKEADRLKVEELIEMMDDEIKSELKEFQKSRKGGEDASDFTLERWQAMMGEKIYYQNRIHDSLSIRMASVKANRNDDEELLTQKADFLMDQQEKLLTYAEEINNAIRRYQTEEEIKNSSEKLFDPLKGNEVKPPDFQRILSLTRYRILPSDDFTSIIEKLKGEKQTAMYYAKRYESEAKDLYRLAQYKAK